MNSQYMFLRLLEKYYFYSFSISYVIILNFIISFQKIILQFNPQHRSMCCNVTHSTVNIYCERTYGYLVYIGKRQKNNIQIVSGFTSHAQDSIQNVSLEVGRVVAVIIMIILISAGNKLQFVYKGS
jgi:hypothetical protein